MHSLLEIGIAHQCLRIHPGDNGTRWKGNEGLQEKLCTAGWDLAVFDEAHKLVAHYFGAKLEKTARFRFAEKLGAHVRQGTRR